VEHTTGRSVIVLGDLCVDTVFDAPDLDLPIGSELVELSQWGPMRDHLGGTAYNFARYAAGTSLEPIVLGCLGDDAAGRFIEEQLAAENLCCHVWRTAVSKTARTVLIYGSNGTRMMFAAFPNANMSMPVRFVDTVWPQLSGCRAVWLSGLCLRDRGSDRFTAVLELLDRARAAGMKVLLDIVPHDFHLYFRDLDALLAEVGAIDVVASDVAAARRLLGVGTAGETVTDSMQQKTAKMLLATFDSVILRHRDGLDYKQLYQDRDGCAEWMRRQVPPASAARGYGDKFVCEVLESVL
jgi:sugar/nucleoside kinase (ribokinase family)